MTTMALGPGEIVLTLLPVRMFAGPLEEAAEANRENPES